MSKAGLDNNGHVGMTLVEALDTLWLMDMRDEFDEGVRWVEHNLTLTSDSDVSVFDYNARLLGGLLSAYELSKKRVLLNKAVEVGNLLMRVFRDKDSFPAVGLTNIDDR